MLRNDVQLRKALFRTITIITKCNLGYNLLINIYNLISQINKDFQISTNQ